MEKQNAVTREISETVEESLSASREVATQIVNVSNEAIEAGRRASEIRDGAAEIAGKVDGLRSTLVRVVRTSTAEADRREFVRQEIDRHGRVDVRGTSHQVVVRDLSERGARIDRVIPAATVDTPVVMAISGLPVRLDGVIARLHKDCTSIKFNLSDAATTAVRAMLEGQRAA
jgi:methyl-accepting chemotaxis protein